jgi:glycosyltransferase involved in cell wall biosynthesis
MRRIESTLCETAAFILTPLPKACDYLVPRGVPPAKIVWIPNGVDFGVFPPPRPPEPHSVFTFMYFGAHGAANELDRLLEAMRILNVRATSPIRLRLVGSGPKKAELQVRASRMRLENVTFENAVPKLGVAPLGATADAFVFNLAPVDVFRFGISSNKLFDYMACGRPIVFCATAYNDPVREAGAGVSAAPNADSLADAMLSVSQSPREELLRMGAAARCYVAKYHDMDQLAARLARLLDAAASGRIPCAA